MTPRDAAAGPAHAAERILTLVERHLATLPAEEREARLKDFRTGLAEEARRTVEPGAAAGPRKDGV